MGWRKKLAIIACFAVLLLFLPSANAIPPPIVIFGCAKYDGEPMPRIEIEARNKETGEILTNITTKEGKFVITLGNPPYGWEIGNTIILEAKGLGNYSCLQGYKEIVLESGNPLEIDISLFLS